MPVKKIIYQKPDYKKVWEGRQIFDKYGINRLKWKFSYKIIFCAKKIDIWAKFKVIS